MAAGSEALDAAHALYGSVVTILVERRADVTGAAGVVIASADGRVIGYQPAPDPAEALSDLVDTGVHRVEPEAYEHLPEGAEWSSRYIPVLLEQDVPVYAFEA